jgi:steroid delta-isomerase-like uncharacterized protein
MEVRYERRAPESSADIAMVCALLIAGIFLEGGIKMSTDMARILQDYVTASNSHDWNKISPLFTDDCVYEDIGAGEVCHGKQELKAYFDGMLVWSADFRIESKSLFATGNGIASEWVMTGTHKATGKKYSIRGVSVSELRDGRIRRNTDYWNMSAFLEQIGWLPGAPAD